MMADETSETPAVIALGGGRRRGRPRVTPGESVRLTVRVWSEHFDALQRDASSKRVEFADYVRTILTEAASRR